LPKAVQLLLRLSAADLVLHGFEPLASLEFVNLLLLA
jgi:hypothetical protein